MASRLQRSPHKHPHSRSNESKASSPHFGATEQHSRPSPLFTDISLSDSDTASSHDTFYLEKYNNMKAMEPTGGTNVPEPSRTKRTRPELNVVTCLPASQARACDDDLKLDHVQAKRIGATTRPKSVVSAKAEHFDASAIADEPERTKALTKLTGLVSAALDRRQKRSPGQKEGDTSALSRPTVSANTARADEENKKKAPNAVMIGIQVPEHEAAMHQQGDNSAITLDTPMTPTIVITPAEPAFHASSSYSKGGLQSRAVPATPAIPTISDHDIRDERESVIRAKVAEDQSRHKSQGWWNLSLSPMLSRAGTIKAASRDSVPEVPPIPEIATSGRPRANTTESQASPETPRRLGLAGIRASVWTHWTTEHKPSLDRRASANTTFPRHTIIEDDDQESLVQKGETQIPDIRQPPGGLADEYYHACAIEQLSGQAFFECQNHSCVDQWPTFQSIYDKDDARDRNAGLILAEVEGSKETPAGNKNDSKSQTKFDSAVHGRSFSSASDEDLEFSPHIREAEPASILQARAVDNRTPPTVEGSRGAEVPATIAPSHHVQPNETATVRMGAVPPPRAASEEAVHTAVAQHPKGIPRLPANANTRDMQPMPSPGPISPAGQKALSGEGDVPMSEMYTVGPTPPPPHAIVHNYYHYPSAETPKHAVVNTAEQSSEIKRTSPQIYGDGEYNKADKPGLISRIKASLKRKKTIKEEKVIKKDKKTKRKYRCIVTLICLALMAVIIAAVLLATLLPPRGDRTPTQSQWLNLTGYPPIPTGISTIIRPNMVDASSQCVQPQTMWSCALPPEEQFEIAPNDPDQPNFRFEIKFRNGTVASNLTIPVADRSSPKIRSKRMTNPFADDSYKANPIPPSRLDQLFMGNTTDNNTVPFDGEDTPFYMSLVPAFPINPSDVAASNSTSLESGNDTSANPALLPRQSSLSASIPSSETDNDGLPAAGNLLPNSPFPTNQPIRLYNRGLPTEHFGFYIYYDRSIFLSTDVVSNTNATNTAISTPDASNTGAGNPSDASGGSARNGARSRCTWAQTRFLVQIWTSPQFSGGLLAPVPVVGAPDTPNSAINYTPPGSFPYPTTITLDRHGGNVEKKIAYCYAIDEDGKYDEEAGGRLVLEFRGAGGQLVNQAPGIVAGKDGEVSVGHGSGFEDSAGGIDGGTGGCACRWQNWK